MAQTRNNLARLGRIPADDGRYRLRVNGDELIWELDTGTPNPNPVDGTNVVANPGLDPNNEKLDSITIANSSGVNVDYNVDPRGPLERFRTKINDADVERRFGAFTNGLPSTINYDIDGVTDAVIAEFDFGGDSFPNTITYRGSLVDELYSTPSNPVTNHRVFKRFTFPSGSSFPTVIEWDDAAIAMFMVTLNFVAGTVDFTGQDAADLTLDNTSGELAISSNFNYDNNTGELTHV